MATAAITTITEDDFICKICDNVLHNNPHSLPCLHHYCGDCVKKIQRVVQKEKEGILCQVCKQFCENKNILPNNLMKSIVQGIANRYNKELLNKPIHAKVCRHCKKTNVTAYCVNCQFELCSVCQYTHLEINELKHHNVVALGDATNLPAINVVKMCPLHPTNPIKVHCKPCKKAICVECILEAHNKHSTENVEKALSVIIPEVQSKLRSIKSRCDDVKEIRAIVVCINEATTVNFREVIQQAEFEMERKISKLRSDFSALQNKVFSQAPLKLGEMIKQDLDHTISCMETLYTWAKTLTEVTQGPGVLYELQNELKGRLDAYAEDKLDTRDADEYIQNPPDQAVFTPAAVPILVGKMEFKQKSHQYLSVKPKMQHQIPKIISKTVKEKAIPKVKVVDKNVKQSGVLGKQVASNLIKSFRHTEANFRDLMIDAPKELKSFQTKHQIVRFCYFDGHIWTACRVDNCIDVYTVKGKCIRTISCPNIQEPLALHPLTSQHMVVAAKSGLYTVDVNAGKTESQIIPVDCHDVHVTEALIAVLEDGKEDDKDSVHILSTTPPYTESAHFSLTHESALTLLVHGGHIYISAGQPLHNISKYNMNGQQLEQYGEPGRKQPGLFKVPRLCLTDSSGSILVTDGGNKRIQLLRDGRWSVVKGLKIKEPSDLIVVQGQMYVSSWKDKELYVYDV